MNEFIIYHTRLDALNSTCHAGKKPCVYVIELDDGKEVKIGYSTSLWRRLNDLNKIESRYRDRIGRVAVWYDENAKDVEFQFHNHMWRHGLSDCKTRWESYDFTRFVEMNSFDYAVEYCIPIFVDDFYPIFSCWSTKQWRKFDKENEL